MKKPSATHIHRLYKKKIPYMEMPAVAMHQNGLRSFERPERIIALESEVKRLVGLYNELVDKGELLKKDKLGLEKKHRSLLRVAKNVRKHIPRTVDPVKKIYKTGDATYLKTIKREAYLKEKIKEAVDERLMRGVRRAHFAVFLHVMMYERFLEKAKLTDGFFRMLYIISLYKWCLVSDIVEWGISKTLAERQLLNMMAMGLIEQVDMQRTRRCYRTTHDGESMIEWCMRFINVGVRKLANEPSAKEIKMEFLRYDVTKTKLRKPITGTE